METLYYSLHNYNKDFSDFEVIRLWYKNNKGSYILASELERYLDAGFSVVDELCFYIEDLEDDISYSFEPLPISLTTLKTK